LLLILIHPHSSSFILILITSSITNTNTMEERVLAIESTVVSGYVGNNVAVFAMQMHGMEVDAMATCVLANHSGRPHGTAGWRLDADTLAAIVSSMRANGLAEQRRVIMGYAARPDLLHALAHLIVELRDRPSAVRPFFFCMPCPPSRVNALQPT
jgi:pyridoxine kinase